MIRKNIEKYGIVSVGFVKGNREFIDVNIPQEKERNVVVD